MEKKRIEATRVDLTKPQSQVTVTSVKRKKEDKEEDGKKKNSLDARGAAAAPANALLYCTSNIGHGTCTC